MDNLQTIVDGMQNTLSNQAVVDAMKQSNASMKQLSASADEVRDVADEARELMQDQADASAALSEPLAPNDIDEDELFAELDGYQDDIAEEVLFFTHLSSINMRHNFPQQVKKDACATSGSATPRGCTPCSRQKSGSPEAGCAVQSGTSGRGRARKVSAFPHTFTWSAFVIRPFTDLRRNELRLQAFDEASHHRPPELPSILSPPSASGVRIRDWRCFCRRTSRPVIINLPSHLLQP